MARRIAKTKTGIGRKATKIYDDNGRFAVQLYSTVVYEEIRDEITLRNGGWPTPTTSQRINSALAYRGFPMGVYIKDGQMFYKGTPFNSGVLTLTRPELRTIYG